MDISIKTLIIGGIALLGGGLAIGRFTLPAKVVTKTEVKTEIKEVVKWKTKIVKQEAKDKETIIIETKYPDGTIKKETRIVDKGVLRLDKSAEEEKKTDTKVAEKDEQSTSYEKNNWHVSGLITPSGEGNWYNSKLSYGGKVERRIVGPFYLGVFGISNNTAGVSVGLGF